MGGEFFGDGFGGQQGAVEVEGNYDLLWRRHGSECLRFASVLYAQVGWKGGDCFLPLRNAMLERFEIQTEVYPPLAGKKTTPPSNQRHKVLNLI